jgi:hypothetical protein
MQNPAGTADRVQQKRWQKASRTSVFHQGPAPVIEAHGVKTLKDILWAALDTVYAKVIHEYRATPRALLPSHSLRRVNASMPWRFS